MFANNKSISITVNSIRKKTFWSSGLNCAGYREYTIDELLEALEIILFNGYIQFIGSIFKNKFDQQSHPHVLLPQEFYIACDRYDLNKCYTHANFDQELGYAKPMCKCSLVTRSSWLLNSSAALKCMVDNFQR